MKTLLVDGKPTIIIGKPYVLVGQILEDIRKELVSQGRVMVGVRIDGKEYSLLADHEFGQLPLSEIDTCEIFSFSGLQACCGALEGALRFLSVMRDDLRKAVALLKAVEKESARAIMRECLSGWLDIEHGMKMLLNIQAVDVRQRVKAVGDMQVTIEQVEMRISQLLRKAAELLDKGEEMELDGVIEDELLPMVDLAGEIWGEWLAEWQDRLEREADGDRG